MESMELNIGQKNMFLKHLLRSNGMNTHKTINVEMISSF